MAHGYQFLQGDELDPEIRVGMYDIWLTRLSFGPTQADRVLIHTPMMEQAHERRFVVSQTCQNQSRFEEDHRIRVGYAINCLEQHFSNHRTHKLHDLQARTDECLTGLLPTPNEAQVMEHGVFKRCRTGSGAPALEYVLQHLPRSVHRSPSPPLASVSFGEPLDVDEDELGDSIQEEWLEARRQQVRTIRSGSSKGVRQSKAPRARKDTIGRQPLERATKRQCKEQPRPEHVFS